MRVIFLILFLSIIFISCNEDDKKECTTKTDCKNWQKCSSENKCILDENKCEKDENCNDGKKCDSSHLCVDMCRNNSDCQEFETCNENTKKCQLKTGKCSKDKHCLEYEECSNHICTPLAGRCKTESDCKDVENKPLCNTKSNTCYAEDVCVGYKECDKLPNTHCEKTPKGEAGCYCNDGYVLNPDGGCKKASSCDDDSVGNSYEEAKEVTIPYNANHKYCPGNTDFFKFDMTAGEYIIVKSNSDKDLSVFLYKKENNSNTVVSSGKKIYYKAEVTAQYYVLVKTQGVFAEYDIKITKDCEAHADCGKNQVCNTQNKRCEEHICNDDNAIGNTKENATEVELPYNAQNKACTAKPDFYKLNLTAGTNLVVNIDNTQLIMELYNEADEEQTFGVASLTYNVTETKTYYLKVYREGLIELNYNINIKTTCTDDSQCVGVFNTCNTDTHQCTNAACPDDGVGNTADDASITSIPHDTDHTICENKADYYKLSLEAGKLISVKASFINRDGDLDINLYKEKPVAGTIPVAKSNTPKNIEKFSYNPAETGTYYLEVIPFRNADYNPYVETRYNLTIKEGCSGHDDCSNDFYCSDNNICVKYPECLSDSECPNNSINNTDSFYCNLPTDYKAKCKLHIAPSCGVDGSNKSSEAVELTLGAETSAVTCLLDQDWYKFTLTENTSDINIKLNVTTASRSVDIKVFGPDNVYSPVYSATKKANLTDSGVNVKMLSSGTYYLYITRWKKPWGQNKTEAINYNITVNRTGGTNCNDASCLELEPRRSTCDNTTKACKTTIANYSAQLGESCDYKINCAENDNLYSCLKGKCTGKCSNDESCSTGEICQSLGFMKPKICIETCTGKPNNYCPEVMGVAASHCTNEGRCSLF